MRQLNVNVFERVLVYKCCSSGGKSIQAVGSQAMPIGATALKRKVSLPSEARLYLQVVQLWRERYPDCPKQGYIYISEWKGTLAMGSQEIPTVLFCWRVVSPLEYSSSVSLQELLQLNPDHLALLMEFPWRNVAVLLWWKLLLLCHTPLWRKIINQTSFKKFIWEGRIQDSGYPKQVQDLYRVS